MFFVTPTQPLEWRLAQYALLDLLTQNPVISNGGLSKLYCSTDVKLARVRGMRQRRQQGLDVIQNFPETLSTAEIEAIVNHLGALRDRLSNLIELHQKKGPVNKAFQLGVFGLSKEPALRWAMWIELDYKQREEFRDLNTGKRKRLIQDKATLDRIVEVVWDLWSELNKLPELPI